MTGPMPPATPRADGYAVALICGEIDQWRHNALFVNELIPAFAAQGVVLRMLDYRTQARAVNDALKDADCRFFVCFNGFGSELRVSDGQPGRFRSAYEYARKPLFDLMHDCPAHESMEHQVDSLFRRRFLLLTDYGYVGVAKSLGMRHARFVPSIAFPTTLPGPSRPSRDRSIDILLPMGFQDPEVSRRRHTGMSLRGRVWREIFEAVVEMCIGNLQLDPLNEVFAACREAGVAFDARDSDSRFLLTTVLDFVKFARRVRLVRAVEHLPVSIMSRAPIEEATPGSRLRYIDTRSASEMMMVMADSRCVICPLPHMTGYHERAMGAFTAGSIVVAAPNHILETEFRPGRDLLIYKTEAQLVSILEWILDDPDALTKLAESGRERALTRFSPDRLAATVASLLELELADPQYDG
jgi:hypothetical protein